MHQDYEQSGGRVTLSSEMNPWIDYERWAAPRRVPVMRLV